MTSRLAEHDLEIVLAEASERARRIVERGRRLRPFAVTLGEGSQLFRHELPPGTEADPSQAVDALAHGVRGLLGALPRAIALVRRVSVHNLLGVGATLAICIAVEHADGLARRCFLPYKRDGRSVVWDEPRSVPCPPWLLASADPDES